MTAPLSNIIFASLIRPLKPRWECSDVEGMAAAHKNGFREQNDLSAFRTHLVALEKKFRSMQQACQLLYDFHNNTSVVSLRNTVKSLLDVIVFVRDADKTFIDWHHRSAHFKIALGKSGLDGRTHLLIENNLHDKFQHVEKNFDKTYLILNYELHRAECMRSVFLDFFTSDLRELSRQASSTRKAYEHEHGPVNRMNKKQKAKYINADMMSRTLATSLKETDQDIANAESSASAWTLVSRTLSDAQICLQCPGQCYRLRCYCFPGLCISTFSHIFTTTKCSSGLYCIVR